MSTVKKRVGDLFTTEEVRQELLDQIRQAEIIFHPDSANTYAAYQVFFGVYEIWVDARNGVTIHAGRIINRA